MTTLARKPKISRNPDVVIGRILDAAEAEFMQVGFEAASTNRITEAFGGSKATLFRYYPNKDRLLAGVIARISANWTSYVQGRSEIAMEPRAWFIAFSEQTLQWVLSEQVLFIGRLGISEGARLPDLKHVFSQVAADPLHGVVADRLDAWMKEGKIASGDPRTLSNHFMDLVVAGPVSRALYGVETLNGAALVAHVTSAVDLFLKGVVTRQ